MGNNCTTCSTCNDEKTFDDREYDGQNVRGSMTMQQNTKKGTTLKTNSKFVSNDKLDYSLN